MNQGSPLSKHFSLNQSRNSNEKLERLEKRLSGLGFSIDQKKKEKFEKLNERINLIDGKLTDIKENSDKSYQQLNKKLNDIQNDINIYRDELEKFKKNHEEILDSLEKKTNQYVTQQKEEWQCFKKKLMKELQNKATSLKTEIKEVYDAFEEKEEILNKYYDCELNKLKTLVQQEITEREKTEKHNLEQIDDRINEIVKTVKDEQMNRKNCVDNLTSLIDQYYQNMKTEIDKERLQQGSTEAVLVNLFEKTMDQFGMTQPYTQQ